MNQHLSAAELAKIATAFPVQRTKSEKLLELADLVEKFPTPVILFSGLEHWGQDNLGRTDILQAYPHTAFGIAINHPPFQADGIGNTVGSALKYLEISRAELHEFSCDCGGLITNTDMAARIRKLAA